MEAPDRCPARCLGPGSLARPPASPPQQSTVAQTDSPKLPSSGIALQPGMPICQTDLPLDWYQEEFKPYAEEYMALPDRTPESILPWLDGYVKPAQAHFGDALPLSPGSGQRKKYPVMPWIRMSRSCSQSRKRRSETR